MAAHNANYPRTLRRSLNLLHASLLRSASSASSSSVAFLDSMLYCVRINRAGRVVGPAPSRLQGVRLLNCALDVWNQLTKRTKSGQVPASDTDVHTAAAMVCPPPPCMGRDASVATACWLVHCFQSADLACMSRRTCASCISACACPTANAVVSHLASRRAAAAATLHRHNAPRCTLLISKATLFRDLA